MFLRVTQPEAGGDGRLRFLKFKAPEDVFSAASTPRFPARGHSEMLRLAPRLAKEPEAVSLQEFLQADSKGVLVDQSGRVVYYAQHMNDDFVNFIDRNHFRDIDNIAKAPADLEFPRGSLELKSSWKVLGPKDDSTKFFTTKATVSVLTLKDGKITIDPEHTRQEIVALVGLHVVGVVDGHPEFIWATFEHNDNAPDLPPGADPAGSQPVNSDQDFSFYAKGTPASESNKKRRLTFKSEADQTFENPVSIFRQFPFGAETELDPAIKTLNANVHAMIDASAPNLAVWKNYRLTGAVWLNNPGYFREGSDFADEDLKQPERKILGGETKLSNATMETFTQGLKVNCFNCHRTTGESSGDIQLKAKRIGVSHILTNAYIEGKQ